jgi:hypothetical protein
MRDVAAAPGKPDTPLVFPLPFSFLPEFGLHGAVLVEYIRGLYKKGKISSNSHLRNVNTTDAMFMAAN